MAELSRAVPARRVPGRRRRQRPGRAPVLVLAPRGSASTTPSSRPTRRPGGMFRRWPFFQRLLSWTKPHAPADARNAGVRALRLEQPSRRGARAAGHPARADGRDVVLPVAARDGGQPRRLRGTRPRRSPLRLPLDGDPPRRRGRRRRTRSRSRRPTASTAAGRSSSRSASPSRTRRPATAWSTPIHYADVRPAETYADQRVLIIGKQNSGFELANGLLPWARQLDPRLAVDGASCRSTRRRSSASGPATSSRSRTTSSAAASASSTPRSTASSGVPDGG